FEEAGEFQVPPAREAFGEEERAAREEAQECEDRRGGDGPEADAGFLSRQKIVHGWLPALGHCSRPCYRQFDANPHPFRGAGEKQQSEKGGGGGRGWGFGMGVPETSKGVRGFGKSAREIG